MAYYSIHFSPTGGTKKVADLLCPALSDRWEQIDLCRERSACELQAEDVCLVSVPSYGGRVPGLAIARLQALRGNGAKAILVCVYGNREWDDTLTELQDALEGCGFVCVAAVAAVAEHSIFRQFAAGRPDADDAVQLAAFAKDIRAKLEAGDLTTPALAGSHGPYKQFGGTPFKPTANDACIRCGACADGCPAHAIDAANPQNTDGDLCISCMRCIALCPQHARDLDPSMLAERAKVIGPHLSGHKENHLFL